MPKGRFLDRFRTNPEVRGEFNLSEYIKNLETEGGDLEFESEAHRFHAESLVLQGFTKYQLEDNGAVMWREHFGARKELATHYKKQLFGLLLEIRSSPDSTISSIISNDSALEAYVSEYATPNDTTTLLKLYEQGHISPQSILPIVLEHPLGNNAELIEGILWRTLQSTIREKRHTKNFAESLFVLSKTQNEQGLKVIASLWNRYQKDAELVTAKPYLPTEYKGHFDLSHLTISSSNFESAFFTALTYSSDFEGVSKVFSQMHGVDPYKSENVLSKIKECYPNGKPDRHLGGHRLTDNESISQDVEEFTPPPIPFSPLEIYRSEIGETFKAPIADFLEEDVPSSDAVAQIEASSGVELSLKLREQMADVLDFFGLIHDAKGDPAILKKLLSKDAKRIGISLSDSAQESLDFSLENAPDLPSSADAFTLYLERRKTQRPISSFQSQLKEKLRPLTTAYLGSLVSGRISLERAVIEIVSLWTDTYALYKSVGQQDVPLYEEAIYHLNRIPKDQQEVFYGRDADFLYWGVKALRLGLVDAKRPKRVNINRYLVSEMKTDEGLRNRILAYLEQRHIGTDDLHIDTGYTGSVPEAVLSLLNPDLTKKELTERIKLLETNSDSKKRSITGGLPSSGASVVVLEARPKFEKTAGNIVEGRFGFYHVVPQKSSGSLDSHVNPLDAWVVRQAVVRHFLPKKESPQIKPRRIESNELTDDIDLSPSNQELLNEARLRGSKDQTHRRQKQFEKLIEKHIGLPEEQEGLLENLARLYEVSRDIIGPVYCDFVTSVHENSKEEHRVSYLGRDGLAPYLISRLLHSRDIVKKQPQYVEISRKALHTTQAEVLRGYLSEQLINSLDAQITLVDIGMYGATHRHVSQLFPEFHVNSHFLISKSQDSNIHGYLTEPGGEQPKTWHDISGNPAVHFLEDTFSGFSKGVSHIEAPNGYGEPVYIEGEYDATELIMRRAALMGAIDAATAYDPKNSDPDLNKRHLEEYFQTGFLDDMGRIMVPHE